MLNSLGGPQIPVALRGRAVFNGTANGKLSDFTIAGHLQMNDFDTWASLGSQTPRTPVRWDYMAADVKASPRMVSARNGVLTRGPTSIDFEGTSVLADGSMTDFTPFTARLRVHNGDLAHLESAAGYSYPISGRIDLNFTLAGTRVNPHGEGHLQLTNSNIYGQAVPQFVSDLRLAGGEAQLNNFVATYRDSRIVGGAAYTPTTQAFHFDVSGTNFNLQRFSELQLSRVLLEGRMDFTAQGNGTLEQPVVNANVKLRDLVLDHERAGDFTFDAVTRGPDLQLTGRSNFEKAELAVDGSVRLREDWPADLSLRFDRLDVDSVIRGYLKNAVTGHSSAAGTLRVHGPLRQLNLLSIEGNLNSFVANIENVSVQNEGPIRFSVEKQVLSLDQLKLIGEGTDITAAGTVRLTGERELDIRADGHVNLKLLESLSPDLSTGGVLNIGVKVNGTYSSPSLLGRVDVVNASLASNSLPNGLSEMNGVLLFNQDRLQIQKLTAHVGGGTVDLSGYMAYTPHLTFNIMAQGTDVRLRPAGISATANAELKLTGSANDAVLSGDVTVVKLALTPGFDFARYLEASKQTTTLPQANSLLSKVRLDVHVTTTPELQMQSTLAKLSGDADLHLRGTIVRPVVLGRVDIMEGSIYFSGTKYRLERGEITFTGPVGIKPTLDLEAATHVRDYDISLGVNGTPDKLSFTYRSEPPLPEPDIIALLALGRTQSESATLAGGSSQSAFSQEASNVILNQALNATLNNRAQRLFGISRIKIDPQGLNTETTPTRTAPAVTIEQQVSSNLTLTYTTEVSQTSQQIIQGEYNLSHNISILAVRDQNGVVSFDVRLRQRKK
jgi:translocation and assembly module TamB